MSVAPKFDSAWQRGKGAPVALSLVIPLYCSSGSVASLVKRLEGLRAPCSWEVIFVDDGSSDDTVTRLQESLRCSRLRGSLVRHGRNFGEHQAVLTGYRHAVGEYIINLDDDLQNPPEEGLRLWQKALTDRLDVVYGDYRVKRHAGWRNWGSSFANGTAHWLLDLPERFYLSSFRCVSAAVAQQAATYQGPYPYIDGLLSQYTRAIGNLKVTHDPRMVGDSGYNLRRLIRLWLNILTSFSVMPLRLASLLGALIGLTGAFTILTLVLQSLVFGVQVQGWLSLISTILVFGGIQCLLIGVLGEYLGRIFLTVSGKPQSFVRSVELIESLHSSARL